MWIEIAAWWPCSTAQMMFSGPHAASPPKNTPARVDCIVVLSTTGMPCLSKSMPMSRSIHGNAFSWPMARMTSSHGNDDRVDDFALLLAVLLEPAQSLELHADELSVLEHEALRRVVLDDLDALFLGVLQFPRRRLEVLARPARDDLHVGAAEPARRAAAVHGRVADADDQHALADLLDVAEVRRREPLDADVDVRRRLRAAGDVEILARRRAAADEHGVAMPRRAATRMLVTGELYRMSTPMSRM